MSDNSRNANFISSDEFENFYFIFIQFYLFSSLISKIKKI